MRQDLKDKFKSENKLKFVAAAAIIIGLISTVILNPRGDKFYMESEKEMKIAMQICQESTEWVNANRQKLKIDAAKLDHIKVNGKIPKLEHVKTPKVIFISSGFVSPNMLNDLFCEITHPATKKTFYYNYEDRTWSNKLRFRR